MKTLIIILTFASLSSFAESSDQKKEPQKKVEMDYGDKQLLRRDACRKPMEALETKYDHISKEDLQKMKDKCGN